MLLRNLERTLKKARAESVKENAPLPTDHTENYVTKRVLEMDAIPEVARVGKQYTHVSALIGICPRRHLLAHVNKLERVNSVNASMRLVWALGRAAETHVRTQFIDAMQRRSILGIWTCKCGFLKKEGAYEKGLSCMKCKGGPNNYKEAPFFDHQARITGSPDLLYIRLDTNKIRVVECKSINKEGFEKLTAPKADHILQGMAYNELLRINGLPQDDSITVIYICKDYQFSSPYKEFSVKRTAEHDSQIRHMWDRANEIANGIRDNSEGIEVEMPQRLTTCRDQTSITAKNCDCVGLCFSKR
jgi:hypothetical protein